MSLDDAVQQAVTEALDQALAPYLRRLSDPEPLVYTVPEVATVLRTSKYTVQRLLDDGALPVVPHVGNRVLVPRRAVQDLVDSAEPIHDAKHAQETLRAASA